MHSLHQWTYINILNAQYCYKDNKQHRYESEWQSLVHTKILNLIDNLWIVPESK
jgi:hypothetical protein